VTRHRTGQNERRVEVVLVVLQRLLHALADRLVPGEVDDRVDPLTSKEALGLVGVTKVERVDLQMLAGDRLEPADHRRLGVGEAVDDQDIVTRGNELDDGVRADVAGPTGDEDSHAHTVCRSTPPVVRDPIAWSHGM